MTAAARISDSLQQQMTLLEREFAQRLVKLPSGAAVAMRERGLRGKSLPLVLLHGISSGAPSWLHTVQRLAPEQLAIAWDAPGYGHSTRLDMPAPTADDYAARLGEFLQALEVERCVLVGHSLGALIAAAFARGTGADRVERLVLISPAGGYGAASQSEARERVRRERREALATLGVTGLAARIDQRLLSPAAADPQREWVRWNTSRLHPQGYLQGIEMLCNSELVAPAGIPVEVHCGDADVVTPADGCRAWAQRNGASFHVISGAGHASPIEQPEAVAQVLRAAACNVTEGSLHV